MFGKGFGESRGLSFFFCSFVPLFAVPFLKNSFKTKRKSKFWMDKTNIL